MSEEALEFFYSAALQAYDFGPEMFDSALDEELLRLKEDWWNQLVSVWMRLHLNFMFFAAMFAISRRNIDMHSNHGSNTGHVL